MRTVKRIVVHTTATREGQPVTVEDIDEWHKDRGWKGIGYHHVVYLDGTVHEGRPEAEVGAHVFGHNADSIGIVYVGGLDKNGNPKDTRTYGQKVAMRFLLSKLVAKYPEVTEIVGHRDLSPDVDGDGIIEPFEWLKACPCFDAIPEYQDLLTQTNQTYKPANKKPVPPAPPEREKCGWFKSRLKKIVRGGKKK